MSFVLSVYKMENFKLTCNLLNKPYWMTFSNLKQLDKSY